FYVGDGCMKKRIFYPLFLIFGLIISGWLVQYIPPYPTEKNIDNSCEIFNKEREFPTYYGRTLDNYTDAVMLLVARTEPDEPSFNRFLTSPLYNTFKADKNWNELYALRALCARHIPRHKISYFRYWHGYQLVLRPLLWFTDYQHIRQINKYLQPLLFLILMILFYIKRVSGLILGWALSYVILNPGSLPLNMTYSIIYFVTVISSIIMLCFKEKIEKHIGWPIFFMMIGICTSFFDFLTYPIVALAVPMTILFYIEPAKDFRQMLKNLALICIYWLIGYAGMWGLKWLLCYLLTDENVYDDIIKSVVKRTTPSFHHQDFPFYTAITKTFYQLFVPQQVLFAVVISLTSITIAILWNIKKCWNFAKEKYFQLLPFAVISSGLFAYCLIMRGHPMQHSYYAFRIWIAFFFPLVSGLNFWAFSVCDKQKGGFRWLKKQS
ncbi:MAG: hypothetical protein IKO06_01305, partial [Alphaproteobacteria bacterium]|nr:hypothetical protein [Alphaproteobacteria bacterium]